MYEAVLHVKGDGAYEQATRRTDTSIELWCNDHCDLLQVRGPNSDHVLETVDETVGIREQLRKDTERILITDDCLKDHFEDTIDTFLERHDCLLVPPLTYESGEKRARVLALDADTLSAFYRDLTEEYDVHVETKQAIDSVTPDSPFLTVDALLPDLSARQRTVLRTAHRKGYYELPRETTTEEIAEEVGIQRRTAEDHLRLAEKRLVDAVVEYL
ncbi:MAG: helix-turn-helix domain-containing protein [Haloarculaceae archaeon]